MAEITVKQREDGRLVATRDGGKPIMVQARLCFPWSEAQRFITLRDAKDKEVALVRDLADLDPESRRAVKAGLAESCFVLEVEGVDSVKSEFEVRNWRVRTRQGNFMFQTKLEEWPLPMPDGRLLMKDVAGNLLRFADPKTMDARSQKLLWGYTG